MQKQGVHPRAGQQRHILDLCNSSVHQCRNRWGFGENGPREVLLPLQFLLFAWLLAICNAVAVCASAISIEN